MGSEGRGSIPANDDGREQIEHSHAVVLALAGQVEPGRSLRALQMIRLGMFHLFVIRSSRQGRHYP